jgi:hypothetical protein
MNMKNQLPNSISVNDSGNDSDCSERPIGRERETKVENIFWDKMRGWLAIGLA